MTKIRVLYMPAFKKVYKKFHVNEKVIVDNIIEKIIKNPKLGEEKKGDLKSVFVYKFKSHHQEMLLAYAWNPKERLLLALGVYSGPHWQDNNAPNLR